MHLESFLALDGALVDRVDRPAPGLYALTLTAGAGRLVLLLAAGRPRCRPAWAIAAERPRGEAADAEVRGLREKMQGGRIGGASATGGRVVFELRRGGSGWQVTADRRGLGCAPLEPGGALSGGAAARGEAGLEPMDGEALVAEQRALVAEQARARARTLLVRAREKLARRAAAIERDRGAVDAAEQRAREASLFVPAAARARPGAARLEATDWSSGEGREVRFALDPARPAREQLEAVFARARRLRGGLAVAERRRDEAAFAALLVDESLARLGALLDPPAVEAELRALGRSLPGDVRLEQPAQVEPRARPREAPGARPYRRFETARGRAILVGRDAASNDALTVRVARPGDLWLHARAAAGAHVVVPAWSKEGGGDAEALLDAATLSAHFSDLRGEAVAEVGYCDRRYVRKRRGSAPGEVEALRERVLAVRVEPARLARLLASADRAPSPR